MSNNLVWITGVTQAVTATVALAALIVSIYSIYLQRLDKRPRLKVTGSVSTLMDSRFEPVEDVYMLNVANIGQMPATVTQVYLWDRPDCKLAFLDIRGQRPFPCKLEPGEGTDWWFNYEALRKALRKQGHRGKVRIKLEATDATGRSHNSHTSIVLNAPWWRRMFGE